MNINSIEFYFIWALAIDAEKNFDKLRTAKEVWDDEWETLLEGIF